MPFAAAAGPLIGLAGGLLGSAFGKSGKQGGQNQSSTGSVTGQVNDTANTQGQTTTTQTENPLLDPFRQQFMGALGSELTQAQKPVFGDAEISGFLNQLNGLTNQASTSITNRLAATGGLRSGSAEDQLTANELNRGGAAANFFTQLPFMEKQARANAVNPLLQLGLGFAGRGPTDTTTTEDRTVTGQQNSQQNSQNQSEMDVEGPGFWKSLAGAGAGVLGGLLANNPKDPFSVFRKQGVPTSPSLSNDAITANQPLGSNQSDEFQNFLKMIGQPF